MYGRRWLWLVILHTLVSSSPAGDRDAAVELGKKATAMVDVRDPDNSGSRSSGSGSAFCVDRSGLFVTNVHMVAARRRRWEGRRCSDLASQTRRSSRRG